MNKMFISSLTSAITAAVMIMILVKSHNDKPTHSIAQTGQDKRFDQVMSKVMDEVNAIKKELVTIRSQQSRLSLSNTPFDVNQIANAEENFINTEISEEDEFITLDEMMDEENSDSSEDDETASQLINSFQNTALVDFQLEEVTCKGTMCRIDILHDREKEAIKLLDEAQQWVPWEYTSVLETIANESDDFVTTMYIKRKDEVSENS